ncbi:hypothetical protein ACFU2J_35640, partial [Streptomyces sp. NPDC057387]
MNSNPRPTTTLVPPVEKTRYEEELARGFVMADEKAFAAVYRHWGSEVLTEVVDHVTFGLSGRWSVRGETTVAALDR